MKQGEVKPAESSVNPNWQQFLGASKNGKSWIFFELWRSRESKRDVWNFLSSSKARDEDGYNALHIAVASNQGGVVRAILGGDDQIDDPAVLELKFNFLHARTSKGRTALHLAVASANVELQEILMKQYDLVAKAAKRPLDFADCYWMTPLHYAVLKQSQKPIELLLKWDLYGQHVNARDYFQRTPLHMAACHCPVSVNTFAGCSRVNMNALDCVMHSPLHWAISFGRADVVECLSEKKLVEGAFDLDIEGRSVLEMTVEDNTVDLPETMITNGSPEAAAGGAASITNGQKNRRELSGKIKSQVMRIPSVKDEVERSSRKLQFYLNATIAILLAAALIASASVGWSRQLYFSQSSQFEKDLSFLCKSSALVLAVMTLITSIATLGLTVHATAISSVAQLKLLKYVKCAFGWISGMISLSVYSLLWCFQLSSKPVSNGLFIGVHVVLTIFTARFYITIFVMQLRHSTHQDQLTIRKERKEDQDVHVAELRSEGCGKKTDYQIPESTKADGARQGKFLEEVSRDDYSSSPFHRQVLSLNLDFVARCSQACGFRLPQTKLSSTNEVVHGHKESSNTQGESEVLLQADKVWQQRGMSFRNMQDFKVMKDRVYQIEKLYEKWTNTSKNGDNTDKTMMRYLDGLPNGILCWVKIFTIDQSCSLKSLILWIFGWNFPMVTFYQGYALERDLEKVKAILDEIGRKKPVPNIAVSARRRK